MGVKICAPEIRRICAYQLIVGFQAPVLSYRRLRLDYMYQYDEYDVSQLSPSKKYLSRVSHQKDSRRGVRRPCLMNLYHTNTYPLMLIAVSLSHPGQSFVYADSHT
jgi:hypothetical protein